MGCDTDALEENSAPNSGSSDINPEDRGRMFLRNTGIRQEHLYGVRTQNITRRKITDKQT
jgi:hypothetical protein